MDAVHIIHYFHIICTLFTPQKFCTTILFDFFCWDDCITLDKLEKKMVMQNFGGLTGCIVVYVKMVNAKGGTHRVLDLITFLLVL